MLRRNEDHGHVDVVLSWLLNWLTRESVELQPVEIRVIRDADLLQWLAGHEDFFTS